MDSNKPYYYGSQAYAQGPNGQPGYPQQQPGQAPYYNPGQPGGYNSPPNQTGPSGYPPGQGGPYYPGHPNTYQPPFSDVTQLTREELAVLKECNRESFWRRSVPLATINLLAVSVMHKNGMLNTARRYLHYFTAVGVGYFIGKASYISVCKEKIKGLRNSPLAEALSRKDKIREVQLFQDMSQLPGFDNLPEVKRDDGMSYHPYDNGELYRDPQFAANTSEPGSQDQDQGDALKRRPTTTYDELRRKNREQYWRQYGNPQQPQPTPGQSPNGPWAPGQPNNYRPPNQNGPVVAPPTYSSQSGVSNQGQSPSSYW